MELARPENLVNVCARHTKTLDGCFDLIKSQQQRIPWSSPLEIEPATTKCPKGHVFPGGLEIRIRLKGKDIDVCRVQVFAGFSDHGNSIHNIIPLFK